MTALLAKVGCVGWSLWIVIDYLAHHQDLTKAVAERPYVTYLSTLLVLGSGLGFLIWRRRKQRGVGYKIPYRGIGVYLLVQLFAGLLIAAFAAEAYLPNVPVFSRISYFFCYSSLFFLGLLLISTLAYVLGRLLLHPLRSFLTGPQTGVSIAFGFSLIGLFAVLLAWAGVLKIFVVWPIVIALLGWQWRAALTFLKRVSWERRELELNNWWSPLLLLTLISILGFNWVGAFKTFPIGYDGAGLYVNLAEITATTGSLPKGWQAYNWSVVMAFGHVLSGSRIMAILLSHLMSVFCLLMIYRLGRLFLSPAYALLGALLVFTAPYFSFHALVDEKIDLALTFLLLSVLTLFLNIYRQFSWEELRQKQLSLLGGRSSMCALHYLMVLVGWLMGYAFGVKYTTLFFMLGLFCTLAYYHGGKKLFSGMALALLGSVLLLHIYRFGLLDIQRSSAVLIGVGLLITSIGWIFYVYRKDLAPLRRLSAALVVLMIAFTVAFSPWAIKNLSEHGTIGVGQLIEGKSDAPELELKSDLSTGGRMHEPSYGRFTKTETEDRTDRPAAVFVQNARNRRNDGIKSEAADAELRRYLGFEPGIWLHTSLPYDVTMNTNARGSRYTDLGYLLLLAFPLLLLLTPGERRRAIGVQIATVLAVPLWMATNYLSVYAVDGVLHLVDTRERIKGMFATHPGGNDSWFYQLYDALLSPVLSLAKLLEPIYLLGSQALPVASVFLMLGITALIVYLAKPRFAQLPKVMKGLSILLFVYLAFWWLMGSGVLWYAMPAFAVLPAIVVWWWQQPAAFIGEENKRFTTYFWGTVLSLVMLGNVTAYFTSAFPGDTTTETIFRWPFLDYVSNPTAREQKIFDAFNPALSTSMKFMNADLNDKIYKVNTHYGFLIEQNNRRVYKDPVLDKFTQLTQGFTDKSIFFDILKANGYRYIFLDLRTAFVDKTPEQTLRKTFIELANALLTSDKVRLITTDNYIEDLNAEAIRLPNGNMAKARMGLNGQTLYLGNIALFEIR